MKRPEVPAVSPTRVKFVEAFGEEQAAKVEVAAAYHESDDRTGSDAFRWALATCIGYECLTRPSFRAHHGITVPEAELRAWVIACGDLANHDGDVDYISVFTGEYQKWMPASEGGAEVAS